VAREKRETPECVSGCQTTPPDTLPENAAEQKSHEIKLFLRLDIV